MPQGKRIGILVEEGFDDSELIELLRIAADFGLALTIGSSPSKSYRGKDGKLTILAATSAAEAVADDYDAILVPGGYAPDEMRLCQSMVDLVKRADNLGKVIVAVSHGPQLLISADIVRGRRITSWPSIAIDLENAGALWRDEPLVQDGNIISTRRSCDLPLLGAVLTAALDTDLSQGDPARANCVGPAAR
ncbi:MAG: DJ-1/PfpI family protein [Dehalococcoidia bacterium]|nr:DJ-1/PfpI family protein [Dehalococcoidia bacterium]